MADTERESAPSDQEGVLGAVELAEEHDVVLVEQETAVEPAVPRRPSQPDGSVEGYRASRTLPFGVELRRQIVRRRTKLTLGFLAVLPLLLLGAFEVGSSHGEEDARTAVDLATSSGLNFAVFALLSSTNFLLVIVTALFFGDTVASEASWSSLKYLLAAPIPRSRLLRQKACVSAVLTVFGLGMLATVALVVGVARYGTGQLITSTGEALSFPGGLVSVVLACGYLMLHLSWIAGLALWLSVSTDAPLGAVGGAVVASILSHILDDVTALGALRTYLPTHYSMAWADLLSEEVDWTAVANGVFTALAYATAFGLLALRRFRRKDITS
jgi:ABC-2 type transport system permease protein